MSDKKPSRLAGVGKWFAGILATIVGAMAVWWLTSDGGPLKPKKIKRVTVLSLDTDGYAADRPIGAEIRVYNPTDTPAVNCHLAWASSRKTASGHWATVATHLWAPDDPKVLSGYLRSYVRPEFAIRPGETVTLRVTGRSFDEAGSYRTGVSVWCSGQPGEVLWREIVVAEAT